MTFMKRMMLAGLAVFVVLLTLLLSCALVYHGVTAAEVEYTCPMHPEIVRDAPGKCPICKMDLVAREAGAEHGDTPSAAEETGGKPAADTGSTDGKTAAAGRTIKYWVAPMDPTYIRNEPGKSPMGMDLVPVYADAAGEQSDSGTVRVDPVMVQNMGVRVAPVVRGTIYRNVRTIGEVDVAEDEISVVNLRYSGWIEKIYADRTGDRIARGQKLFSLYSPELVAAQKEYLLAVKSRGKNSSLARSAGQKLLYRGIPRHVLDRIAKTGSVDGLYTVVSPRSGYILHKNVEEGARVAAGKDLYRIGNLDRIWVTAEIYEYDAPWIAVGQDATMELSFQAGRQWTGTVDYIYPTLDRKSRTLPVRLAFDNPGLALKPGMFATVRIATRKKEGVLIIPTEAIIHSGERQIVFITRGIGRYAAREIVTGLTGAEHVTEVLSGLDAGDTVVISGQFLLDSESQLQEAVRKMLDTRLQKPAAAGTLSGAGNSSESSGHADDSTGTTYWTCSMHSQVIREAPGTCPQCGMDLVQRQR